MNDAPDSTREEEGTGAPDREKRPGDAKEVCVGLLAAPDLPTDLAEALAPELPDALVREVDDSATWRVSVLRDPLPGAEENVAEIIEVARKRKEREKWDYAVCLTDMPLRAGSRPVVAEASRDEGVAIVSIPALGAAPLTARVREAIVGLVTELTAEDRSSEQGRRRLIGRRLSEVLAPIRRLASRDGMSDTRFVTPAALGHVRLVLGMVRANRPWRLLPALKATLAAALATAAYALVTPGIWQESHALGGVRLAILTVGSIVAMVVWLIVSHHLWERTSGARPVKEVVLYNAGSGLTLVLGVLFFYFELFVLTVPVALVITDASLFGSYVQQRVDLGDYLTLAWFAASLATVAGALGSGVDSDEAVRSAAYGHRQQRRLEEVAEQKEEDRTGEPSA